MKKVLRQFRYYGSQETSLNAPSSIDKERLRSGDIFFSSSDVYSATIVSLGIQTVPGVQFYLNDSVDTIIVGSTGIYELNLSDGYEIKSLRFTQESMELIDHNTSAYLIIDVVYNTEE